MKAVSIKGNSAEEIKSRLAGCMADGFSPTLAIVFMSVKQDRKGLSKLLDDAGIAVYGATTHGEFIDEDLGHGTIAILLLDINPAYFSIYFEQFDGTDYRRAARAIAEKAKAKFSSPAFLVASCDLETDVEELLSGFEDVIGRQVNLFGAMAGDDYAFSQQHVFTNNNESSQGIVVIALDEQKIIIKGNSTCGWKAVGTAKTVTKSDGKQVWTVDDTPVLELIQKFSGLTFSENEADVILKIATNFPLQLQKETGDPVMRPAQSVNFEDGSLTCSGRVPQGSKVRFSLPPDFDVMETVVKRLEELKATEMPAADALIVFSCGGRFASFGPMMNTEIEGIRKVWNVPMAGLFSNAELGRATDGNLEMHNLTTCCVALKEK
jgi:hypothetical protein